MKRFVAVLTIIGLLLAMIGCSFLPLDMLDDPADPEASSYQGFHSINDPDQILLYIPDNTKITEPTLIFSQVVGAEKYQIQIASDEEFLDSVVEEVYVSKVVDMDLKKTYHLRYWRVRAFVDDEWGAWSKTGTFIYLHPNTVYFDAQGGSVPNSENETIVKGNPYGSLSTTINGNKYLDGWWTKPEGKGEQIFDTTIVGTDESHILYAKWLDTYQVTYNGNENTGGVAPANQWKVQGRALNLQGRGTLDRPGHYLIGWNTRADGSGTTYVEDSTYDEDSALTLYAKWIEVAVGKLGPAGGYIFYDKGSYDDGWRYLEAAPSGWSSSEDDPEYCFGFHRGSSYGSNILVGTDTAIGSGKANTQALVSAMGNQSYTSNYGNSKDNYAAKAAFDYSRTVDGVTYNGWFLPSKDELNKMYENLHKKDLGGFCVDYFYYWSSSEYYDGNNFAWGQCFYDGCQCLSNRYYADCVRPARAF